MGTLWWHRCPAAQGGGGGGKGTRRGGGGEGQKGRKMDKVDMGREITDRSLWWLFLRYCSDIHTQGKAMLPPAKERERGIISWRFFPSSFFPRSRLLSELVRRSFHAWWGGQYVHPYSHRSFGLSPTAQLLYCTVVVLHDRLLYNIFPSPFTHAWMHPTLISLPAPKYVWHGQAKMGTNVNNVEGWLGSSYVFLVLLFLWMERWYLKAKKVISCLISRSRWMHE